MFTQVWRSFKCTMTLAKREQEEAEKVAINLCYLWRMVLPALFIITARHLNEKLSCKSHLSVVNKKRRRSRLSRRRIGGLFLNYHVATAFHSELKTVWSQARDKQIRWRRTIYGMPKAHKRAVIRFSDEIDLHKLCQLNVDTKKRFLRLTLSRIWILLRVGATQYVLCHIRMRASYQERSFLLRSQIRSFTTDFRLQKAETKNI